jgi:hypothetical protein
MGEYRNAALIHSTRNILVDRGGVIRGYYDATDADALLACWLMSPSATPAALSEA